MKNFKRVIWKDQHDQDTYHVGSSYEHKEKDTYTRWFSIHVDGLGDMFDMDAGMIKKIGFEPIEIYFNEIEL